MRVYEVSSGSQSHGHFDAELLATDARRLIPLCADSGSSEPRT
jgi:hypothetical protein